MWGAAGARSSAEPLETPHVLIVAQAFKGTLKASEVAAAVAAGVSDSGAAPEVILGSDGGDGLLEALEKETIRRSRHRVTGPLSRPVEAEVAWIQSGVAVIESRLACGLSLVPANQRNPRYTTTRGVGELIMELAGEGAEQVIVGLGGSATMDGGVGMARAFGWIPTGPSGKVLPDCGGSLADLEGFEPGVAPPITLLGLADVRNPLLGPLGAAVYAPQKGASAEDVAHLMRGLERLVNVLADRGARELAQRPGAGAAGGLGFGILFFGQGKLVSGAEWILDRTGFDRRVEQAALVVVAEAAFDRTSLEGKLTGEVLRRAARAKVPVVLLSPRVEFLPRGLVVESGEGIWTTEELRRRAARAIERTTSAGPRCHGIE